MNCNENVVKNMANEITRNCQAQNVTVDSEFVVYLIELLLLNPKYGKLFTKTIKRNNLEFFVNECVNILTRGEVSVNTLKMQFTIQTNYDKLQNLVDKHLDSIESCLRPLVNEIMDAEPELDDENEFNKLFRKISIYIILASGLGNPGVITTLKEGMAALESVFSIDDLKLFVVLPRNEKQAQLNELLEIVSGVRLFNRDCKKGGEGIPDLPFKLVDAGKACLTSLSNSLISVMQRVNSLTTAIEDSIIVQEETSNVIIEIPHSTDLTENDYKLVFALLSFNRQYEVIVRKLLNDVELMVDNGMLFLERVRQVLAELHAAVKFKSAVPVVAVFPLFSRLWQIWRGMQNLMYLVSTVNKLMTSLAALQEDMKIPFEVVEKMLRGKYVVTDLDRMNTNISTEEKLSLGSLRNYATSESLLVMKDKQHMEYLGFCAMCLCIGALVPSNLKMGVIKCKGKRYGFCSVKMAARFSKDPDRFINEVLDYARNNTHMINLLNIIEDVYKVKDIENLVTKYAPKVKVLDKDIQTETHPIEEYIERDYTWDLWEWKRRACQWANIVKCRTHSTQTYYSHLRSEIHCQTTEPRDKCVQTKKDAGMNTSTCSYFIWGLRGQLGEGQHVIDMRERHGPEKKPAQTFTTCTWPCIIQPEAETVLSTYNKLC